MYEVIIDSMPMDYFGFIINVISLLIAVASAIIALVMLRIQKKHNLNSIKPIIDIIVGDYEDNIYVKLKNMGVGPAIIDKLTCVYKGSMPLTEVSSSSLISLLTDSKASSSIIKGYSTFVEDVKGRTIPSNDEIVLMRLRDGDDKDNTALRLVLKDITILVEYRDIYDRKFHKERELDFFGRHF